MRSSRRRIPSKLPRNILRNNSLSQKCKKNHKKLKKNYHLKISAKTQ